jgi:hypothetical protein
MRPHPGQLWLAALAPPHFKRHGTVMIFQYNPVTWKRGRA